ncbi:chorismate mutase [Nocardiopsis ganjiahuensis]|uniref:chorismate mutase n=1 Tax=Nocardiopsis ganjiahuensis TaxID=239984 RepID=UPI00034A72E7|nr:chorismate mutase [Nocardiopsis ganjiahuensis]
MHLSRTPSALALAALLSLSPAAALASPASTAPPADFDTLVGLSAERLETAEAVAAAKWHTGSPVDDPAREEQVLEAAREQAERSATDPEHAAAVVRDQIEAHKTVQHTLHARWTVLPDRAPAEEPDLSEVRPELDRITSGLVRELAATERGRARADCPARLALSADRDARERGSDAVHTAALTRSLASVCV